MPTPLYDAVKKYADQEPFRFHMPGHKGGPVPLMAELKWMTPIDLTELPLPGTCTKGVALCFRPGSMGKGVWL